MKAEGKNIACTGSLEFSQIKIHFECEQLVFTGTLLKRPLLRYIAENNSHTEFSQTRYYQGGSVRAEGNFVLCCTGDLGPICLARDQHKERTTIQESISETIT